ncbi:PaaI family thioesterase [bacterium]|nr:PaaI family thioesterase [bacterium]
MKNGKETDESTSLSCKFGHDWCIMCGEKNPSSLHLSFKPESVDCVRAEFHCEERLQGYTGIQHGGVVSALLDAAMTHCLFHKGIRAVTAELNVRFRHSIPHDAIVTIRGWITSANPRLYRLRSDIRIGDRVMATGEAKFMRT